MKVAGSLSIFFRIFCCAIAGATRPTAKYAVIGVAQKQTLAGEAGAPSHNSIKTLKKTLKKKRKTLAHSKSCRGREVAIHLSAQEVIAKCISSIRRVVIETELFLALPAVTHMPSSASRATFSYISLLI